eukprot:349644-Chlamydomonas_euryale.AAC.2
MDKWLMDGHVGGCIWGWSAACLPAPTTYVELRKVKVAEHCTEERQHGLDPSIVRGNLVLVHARHQRRKAREHDEVRKGKSHNLRREGAGRDRGEV